MGADHGASFVPEQMCGEIEDEEYGPSTAHCAMPEAGFTGAWFQPAMADSYSGIYRFSPEDSGVGWCMSIAALTTTAPFALGEITGAAALSAGAAVVVAAIMY